MKNPTIPEVEPQFEKEIDPFQQPSFSNPFQQQVIRCETPTLSARRRSSIFEGTLTPEPSVCRWLLNIISEDEYMVKESAHFVLSENQLIRVVSYTFDDSESQIQLSIEDEGCCDRYLHILDVVLNHDQILYGSTRYNTIVDAFTKQEDCELLALKLNISDQIDAYNKTEADALLLLKTDKTKHIDEYSKTEVDAQLDDKLNISEQIDAQSKMEDDALLLFKTDKTELIDEYSKTEVDALLDDNLNINDQIDVYTKQEEDALLLFKTDKTELIDAYSKTEPDALLNNKFNIFDQIDAYSKLQDDALLLLNADKTDWIIMSIQLQLKQQLVKNNLEQQLWTIWWDSTALRALETELKDMTNVLTNLGTATEGDNAIIDLSFSGNILIPAKNINFVTADYD
ncbi:MAG: hypothetical protein EZS28_012591 [Streblomastix strix]|uniref:Uncharacterized protein n=1 Tax=Streblomastix strix TaxID=222440 RepID=A0A5J4WAC1_9EUKA|nr:MAG: hypothetical protein EZS28_012591 [Streblomastix strix]